MSSHHPSVQLRVWPASEPPPRVLPCYDASDACGRAHSLAGPVSRTTVLLFIVPVHVPGTTTGTTRVPVPYSH